MRQPLVALGLVELASDVDLAEHRLEAALAVANLRSLDLVGTAHRDAPLDGSAQVEVLLEHQPQQLASFDLEPALHLPVLGAERAAAGKVLVHLADLRGGSREGLGVGDRRRMRCAP
jgi:hypothetical protein